MEFKNSQLMMLATIGTFGLLFLLIFFPLPDKNAQIFLAISTFLLGFYFGSSVNKPRTASPNDQGAEAPQPKGDAQ